MKIKLLNKIKKENVGKINGEKGDIYLSSA